MEIHFCDLCNESVPQSDLDRGRAYVRKGRVVCGTCERLMSDKDGPAASGPFATGPGTATAAHPARPAAASSAAPPYAASAHGPSTHGPSAHVHAAPRRGGGGGLLVGLVALVFAGAVAFVALDRIEALRLDHEEASSGLRSRVASVGRQLDSLDQDLRRREAELVELLGGRLDARAQSLEATLERQGADLAADRRALEDVRTSLGELRAGVEQLRTSSEQGFQGLEGRMRRSEEDLRFFSDRVTALEIAATDSVQPFDAGALPAEGGGGGQPAWTPLVSELASPSAGDRWNAVDKLGQTGDPAVVEHLLPILQDPDVFVRMATARVLGEVGDPSVAPALIDALEDPEGAVREAAVLSLRSLTGQKFGFEPLDREADRAKRVKAWRDWWKREGGGS